MATASIDRSQNFRRRHNCVDSALAGVRLANEIAVVSDRLDRVGEREGRLSVSLHPRRMIDDLTAMESCRRLGSDHGGCDRKGGQRFSPLFS